jgi:drug/metabolite transporter (DMT)-like permease
MSSWMNNNNNDRHDKKNDKFKHGWLVGVVLLWIFLGVAAYVTAFNCTSDLYNGGDARKVAMLMLAGLLGPFWFVIYFFVKKNGYCTLKK